MLINLSSRMLWTESVPKVQRLETTLRTYVRTCCMTKITRSRFTCHCYCDHFHCSHQRMTEPSIVINTYKRDGSQQEVVIKVCTIIRTAVPGLTAHSVISNLCPKVYCTALAVAATYIRYVQYRMYVRTYVASTAHLSICRECLSSRAWAFIDWTSIVSGLRRRMYSSWLPMHNARMRLLMRKRGE